MINVGDSRTYLLRNGDLHRATVDHSYVQELVNTGHISEDEARAHPRRNIVTRALGIEPTVRVDTWLVPMVHGDRFILCSDGLVDEVHDDDIAADSTSHRGSAGRGRTVDRQANANGGRDNTTVVVVDVLQGVEPTAEHPALESEPGWPGSETTGTMIDADANSVLSAPGIIATTGDPVPPVVHVARSDEANVPQSLEDTSLPETPRSGNRAHAHHHAIAVLVHNGSESDPSPVTTTVAVTEPDTAAPTSTRPTTTTTSTVASTSTSTPRSSTASVGTSTSGP